MLQERRADKTSARALSPEGAVYLQYQQRVVRSRDAGCCAGESGRQDMRANRAGMRAARIRRSASKAPGVHDTRIAAAARAEYKQCYSWLDS